MFVAPPNGEDAGAVPKREVAGADAAANIAGVLLKLNAAADDAPACTPTTAAETHKDV